MVFFYKGGEQQSFVAVYYIPRLMMNILNIGQHDEVWFKVDIYSGVLKICEPGGQLLAM
jgi:hypothetical protein